MALDQGLTLGELRGELQDLGYAMESVPDAQNRALNAVQRRVFGLRRWKFAEDTDTLTLNAAAVAIDISAEITWSGIDALRLFDGTEELEWEYLEPEEFRRRQWEYGTETGRPLWWTYYSDLIRVLPAADKQYAIEVDVILAPTTMMTDNDRSLVPARFSGVLVWGAIERLAARERDWEQAARAGRQFALEVNAMITAGQVHQRQNATHVPRAKSWDDVGGGRLVWLS